MNKINILIFALVIVIAVLALTIFMQKTQQLKPQSQPTVQTPLSSPKPVKQPIVHYPVPVTKLEKEPAEEPKMIDEIPAEPTVAAPELPAVLPPVELSDESIQDALNNLKLDRSLFKLVLLENFIQRLVATIDNLPEKKLPRAHLPIIPPKPRFIVAGTTDAPQTSRRNFTRYNAYIKLLDKLNPELTTKIYIHFYPLFQNAYEQLGYRNAYFNDRLVNVIDHLLETPDPAEPIQLAQPAVLYTYADPLLEKLSSGQKILLRIGPDHRKKVKEILREYRDQLVNLKP